jgi:arylformamidase
LERTDAGLTRGQIALLHTGWTDRMYGTFPDYFTQSPYLDLDAARWLVARGPAAVVFDFFEEYMARFPDFTSEDFVVHRELLGNGVVIVEGATNLGALKGAGSIQFFAPFFKVAGTEGAPARLFAIVE